MKNLTKYYLGIGPALLLFFCCLSCKKMIEIDPPKNQLVTSQVFADSTDATSAVLGIYINMMNSSSSSGFTFANGAITLYTGLSSDELMPTGTNSTESQFYSNSLLVDNQAIVVQWRQAYSLIYQANACIEELAGSSGISNALKNQLTGESKFIRAFIYFNLVNLYGDVPFVTSTDYKINAVLPRIAKDSVFNKIVADLMDAKELLSPDYVTPGKIRVNQYTAIALLARIYLYQKKWLQADDAASLVISSGLYSLEPNLNDVFLANSSEAIWQLSPIQPEYETPEGQKFNPGASANSKPRYCITPFLLNSFETGDQRMANDNWIESKVIMGVTYYYPYKYKLVNDGNTTPLENYMMFRLAEQYLIRAEARAQQNNISDSKSDLNNIRNRAGLGDTPANDQASLLTAILHERQVELFCEWGHRWYDLKRTSTVDAILGVEKAPNWQSTDALYPIPFNEILLNSLLTQNPGY